jgi:hypothetical protein
MKSVTALIAALALIASAGTGVAQSPGQPQEPPALR